MQPDFQQTSAMVPCTAVRWGETPHQISWATL